MDMEWVMTFVSPTNPTAQLTLIGDGASAQCDPDISVEVDDVDAVHAKAVSRGIEIVYPSPTSPGECAASLHGTRTASS
jgi:hypothetical protein